jgi:hypothetical protein
MFHLLTLDAEKLPEVSLAIHECIERLHCGGELTELGMGIGRLATENELAFNFLCETAHKQSESHQHIVTSALWMVGLVCDVKKADKYIGIISQAIRRYPFRSHLMAFAWILMDLDEEKVVEQYRSNLASFAKLFEAGYESESITVRVWTTLASWYCFVRYPSFLRECAVGILKKAVTDSEWRIRFICALFGGALIADKPNKANTSIFDFVGDLCSSLLQDNDELVRHAAASSIAQLPPATQTVLLDKNSDCANLKSVIDLYLRGSAEEHFTQLLARFYSRDFTWITEELQYEIEALDKDQSKLLIAIWQEKPEETTSIVKKWSKQQSKGLRKTACGFYRTMKKIHPK